MGVCGRPLVLVLRAAHQGGGRRLQPVPHRDRPRRDRGVLAAALLAVGRAPLPPAQQLRPLLYTMLGAVFGWPILLALALERTTSAHVAVIAAFMPLTTALFAVLRTHERVTWQFWAAAGTGTAALVAFALSRGGARRRRPRGRRARRRRGAGVVVVLRRGRLGHARDAGLAGDLVGRGARAPRDDPGLGAPLVVGRRPTSRPPPSGPPWSCSASRPCTSASSPGTAGCARGDRPRRSGAAAAGAPDARVVGPVPRRAR